jgi:oligoendopeptidase F
VLNEGDPARQAYFSFLSSGGSRYPLESLRLAGVDMESAEPVEAVIRHFAGLLERLREHFEARGLALR